MKNCAPDGAQFLNVRISSALLVLLQQHGHALGTRSATEDEHRAERVQRLHYSQSGVSRMIADLEQEWGVTLLECGKAGVVLTGDGARLLPHARALCAEYARLSAEVGALPGRAHISAATRQFLRYLDRRNALEVPAGCTGFDNQARFVYNHYKISDFL